MSNFFWNREYSLKFKVYSRLTLKFDLLIGKDTFLGNFLKVLIDKHEDFFRIEIRGSLGVFSTRLLVTKKVYGKFSAS